MATPVDNRTLLLAPEEAIPRCGLVVCCPAVPTIYPVLTFMGAEQATANLPLLSEVVTAASKTGAVCLAGTDAPLLAALLLLSRRQARTIIVASLPSLTSAHQALLEKAEAALPGGSLVFARRVQAPQVIRPNTAPPTPSPQLQGVSIPGMPAGGPLPVEGEVDHVVLARADVKASSTAT